MYWHVGEREYYARYRADTCDALMRVCASGV